MEMRNVGGSKLRVAEVGLGASNFGGRLESLDAARAIVDTAIGLGVTLIDTADIYADGRSETYLGEILGSRRHQVVLATKFAWRGPNERPDASRGYIVSAVEASLRRLKTDYIDLYQMHYPDPITPIEETLRALDDLVSAGKVRYIGSSNLPAWQLVDADWVARTAGTVGFVSIQREYNILARQIEVELVPAMLSKGVGLLPFFPLANGMFAGTYQKGAPPPAGSRLAREPRFSAKYMTDTNFALLDRLGAFAKEREMTLMELAVGWLLAQPVVACVMAGASRPEQVEQNVAAAGRKLSADELEALELLFVA